MDRDYDIFESLPDGSVMWRGRATGLQATRVKLERLVRDSGKECFAIHLPTHQIVFAVDSSKLTSERSAKRIFQVAYADELRLSRAELLRSLGYAVMSAAGNEAAKILLTRLTDDIGIVVPPPNLDSQGLVV